MRHSILKPALFLITSFTSSTTALIASTSSPCAPQCGNVLGGTSGSDIACTNSDYASTSAGIVFQSCVSCQLDSNYVDPVTKQSDLHWALYNLRYAVSWCLFGYPNNTNAGGGPCTIGPSCGPLESAFQWDSLSTNASSYSYCPPMESAIVPKCTACLQVQKDEFYLTNFVVALDAACQQQPVPGSKVSLDGNIFSSTLVNITSPSTAPTSSYNSSKGGLTLGAKIGIAVGGVMFLLIVTGCCIVCQGKRRRRRFLKKHQQETRYSDWVTQQKAAATPPMPSPGAFFDSPASQRPLVSSTPWATGRREDESPASAIGEKVYFSPYSSQYSSPIDPNEQLQHQPIGQQWPTDRKGSVGGSTGVVAGVFPTRSRSREKTGLRESEGDRIEMQDVRPISNAAPVLLHHPGYGRGRPLTDEDAQNGYAL